MMLVYDTTLTAGKVSDTATMLTMQYTGIGPKKLTLEVEEYRLTGFVTVIDENTVRFTYLGKFRTQVEVTVTYKRGPDLYDAKAEVVVTKGRTKGQRTELWSAEGMYNDSFADLGTFIERRVAVAAAVQ